MKWSYDLRDITSKTKDRTSKKIESNIYVESYSGAIRFIIAVYPLPKETRTCSPDEYKDGLQWLANVVMHCSTKNWHSRFSVSLQF